MNLKNITKLLFSLFFLSGCAVIEKTLEPVDKVTNSVTSSYNSVSNATTETMNNVGNNVSTLTSTLYETSLVKLFSKNEEILKNREENFVKWNDRSRYNAKRIIKKHLRQNDIKVKENELELSQKMEILKNYFFDILKDKHLKQFRSKHKKVTFDKFLTDRENIENINKYKTALTESEHQWNINLHKTQKKVAKLVLSTLFANPKIKFLSYDPYNEEIFLSVTSNQNGFKQKVKFSIDKELAKQLEHKIKYIKPSVYFKFNDDSLEFVGITVIYKKKPYHTTSIDSAYVRQSDIVFTSDKINLKKEDIKYTEVLKNITPPDWFHKIDDTDKKIGYGQGKDEKEAKADAYKNIAQSIKVTVNSNFSSQKKISGSMYSKSAKSKVDLKVEDIDIKNSKILELEKKDGIWFVAISY